MVIYCHSIVITLLILFWSSYHDYHGMVVIYQWLKSRTGFTSLKVIGGILTVENVGTVVKYCGIILTMVPRANVMKIPR